MMTKVAISFVFFLMTLNSVSFGQLTHDRTMKLIGKDTYQQRRHSLASLSRVGTALEKVISDDESLDADRIFTMRRMVQNMVNICRLKMENSVLSTDQNQLFQVICLLII